MKTEIKKKGDTVIVEVNGKLDFETAEPFRQNLTKLIETSETNSKKAKTDSAASKIIFNLENLEFVGSSGISNFVQTLKDFNSRSPVKPKYCNVGSEFQQIIKAFDQEDGFEFFDNEERARRSFEN